MLNMERIENVFPDLLAHPRAVITEATGYPLVVKFSGNTDFPFSFPFLVLDSLGDIDDYIEQHLVNFPGVADNIG